ncbi:lipase family protein [Williamsia sp. CHRR-6]|uniref:lipase family protein n=1 Tax=Williamsia sp. CHRR-6 TaxID=2835871 RepID=UPI001BDAAF50|nr:lipase family protein [Williamsia sp. CHRR-6]MBT0565923.1 lipase [Williamsia sp. CHRR-6]
MPIAAGTTWQRLCVVVITAVLTLTACNSDNQQRGEAPRAVTDADFSGSGPGTLVQAQTMPGIDGSVAAAGARAVRVVYRSTSGLDGRATTVSGAVFVPSGPPPTGGRFVMSLAHGTSGVRTECAPSLTPTIGGQAALIVAYLKLGFVVTVSDYQGLGAPGVHPYLNAKTAGLNVIDAVRAARRVAGGVAGPKWVAFGGSQGGGATWAAAEQAGTYAPELALQGAVSLVPAADMSGLVQLAQAGTLTRDQQAAYIWVLYSLGKTYPDFDLEAYRRGAAAENWETLSVCAGPRAKKRADVLAKLQASDLRPATASAAQRLRTILQRWALPQRRTSAPLLVLYGGRDSYIRPEWTRDAIASSCALGSVVTSQFQPNKGHETVDSSSAVEWLGQRLAGRPAPNNCPGSAPSQTGR